MKKKLIRITTADISLDGLLKGQLRYMNQYYDVVALSNNTGCLHSVGEREGVRTTKRSNVMVKAAKYLPPSSISRSFGKC